MSQRLTNESRKEMQSLVKDQGWTIKRMDLNTLELFNDGKKWQTAAVKNQKTKKRKQKQKQNKNEKKNKQKRKKKIFGILRGSSCCVAFHRWPAVLTLETEVFRLICKEIAGYVFFFLWYIHAYIYITYKTNIHFPVHMSPSVLWSRY